MTLENKPGFDPEYLALKSEVKLWQQKWAEIIEPGNAGDVLRIRPETEAEAVFRVVVSLWNLCTDKELVDLMLLGESEYRREFGPFKKRNMFAAMFDRKDRVVEGGTKFTFYGLKLHTLGHSQFMPKYPEPQVAVRVIGEILREKGVECDVQHRLGIGDFSFMVGDSKDVDYYVQCVFTQDINDYKYPYRACLLHRDVVRFGAVIDN